LTDSSISLPDSIDWRTKKPNVLTKVKNQGQCGSCWAFSTTGGLEGLSKLGYGGLESFSEQQLVDCSKSYGNNGCHGGLMDHAFKYAETNKMETESDYKYTARDGTC
jgi:cathepsin L